MRDDEADMNRVELRDRANRLLGWREAHGDRVEGRDRTGRLRGWYDQRHNETRDAAGQLFGRGDLIDALIVSGA
jgi:hypothetical protein